MLFFSPFLRLFLELSLESSIAIYIQLYFFRIDSSHMDGMSFVFVILFFGANVFLGLVVPILLVKKQKSQYGIQFVRYLNEIYKDLQTNFISHYFYHCIFVLRRASFVILVFYFEDQLYIQVILFIFQNLFYMIYLLYGRPLSSGFYLEIFNETCTLLLSYFLIIFTDYVDDPKVKYYLGYYFLGGFVFNMFINLLVIVKRMISGLIIKIKKVIIMMKLRKGLKYRMFLKSNESVKTLV